MVGFFGTEPPITTGPAMSAGFPVTVGGTVTAAAQRWTFLELHLSSIARLKQLQVVFIVTIETVIVPVVLSMSHCDICMLLGNNEVEVRVKSQNRWLALFMACIAVEVREIRLHSN
jgi:uncharacterized membrane protein